MLNFNVSYSPTKRVRTFMYFEIFLSFKDWASGNIWRIIFKKMQTLKYFQFILSFNEHAFTCNLVCFGLRIAENYSGSYNKEGKLAYLTEKLYILNRWLPMFSQSGLQLLFLLISQLCPPTFPYSFSLSLTVKWLQLFT